MTSLLPDSLIGEAASCEHKLWWATGPHSDAQLVSHHAIAAWLSILDGQPGIATVLEHHSVGAQLKQLASQPTVVTAFVGCGMLW